MRLHSHVTQMAGFLAVLSTYDYYHVHSEHVGMQRSGKLGHVSPVQKVC